MSKFQPQAPLFTFLHAGKRGAFYAPDMVVWGGMGFQVSAIRSRQLALDLLRAYLADFLNEHPTLSGNHIFTSPWADGWLDLALQAVREGKLQRAEDALRRAADEAEEPVIVWPGDADQTIQAARAERVQIAGAVAMAKSILVLAMTRGAA